MSRNALQISTVEAGSTLSPRHKRFNTLLRQIAQARQTLPWQRIDEAGVIRIL